MIVRIESLRFRVLFRFFGDGSVYLRTALEHWLNLRKGYIGQLTKRLNRRVIHGVQYNNLLWRRFVVSTRYIQALLHHATSAGGVGCYVNNRSSAVQAVSSSSAK